MTESSNYEVKKKNIREQTIDNLIKTLEKDPSIWHKTWQKLATNRPYNPITGTKYKGINLINLALSSTSDSRWATYEQAKKAGFPVKKGERSLASVIYHKVNASIEINDKKYPLKSSNQTDLLNEIKVIFSKYSPRHLSLIPSNNSLMIFINTIEHNSEIKFNRNVLVTGIPVFNYTQLSNAPKLESPMLKQEWSDYERAENLLKATNVPIIHDQYDNNFYLPSKNEIHLTPKASFYTPEGYYSTAFHEVAHAKMNDGSIDLGIDLTKYGVDKHIRAKEERC